MKKFYRGSFTIEASVLVPIILMMFVGVIYILFYYHDKNIIVGAAYETAVVGSEREEKAEQELEVYFQNRIKGKLILFANVQGEVEVKKDRVVVRCKAEKRGMKVTQEVVGKRTRPEKRIRDIRKIKKMYEEKENEGMLQK